MDRSAKIFIAGHRGLAGSAIYRHLIAQGFNNIITRTKSELDLCDQVATRNFFHKEKPRYVFVAAALVGGIMANCTRPAEFIYQNLMIETNVVQAAYETEVNKLLFLGSTCIYPKMAPQPLKEQYLLTGPLEQTNESYAVAKIAGIKLCQAYRKQYGCNYVSVMPTNLYGPGDNFDLTSAHVLPALIRKFHEAKKTGLPEVVVWGSGTPRREFLFVDDLAEACYIVMEKYDDPDIINIGTGSDVTIAELAQLIKDVVGFSGNIVFDTSKPDGMMEKRTDTEKMNRLGWQAQISLHQGIAQTYDWYRQHEKGLRDRDKEQR